MDRESRKKVLGNCHSSEANEKCKDNHVQRERLGECKPNQQLMAASTIKQKRNHRLALIGERSSRVMNPEKKESSCRERNWERGDSRGNCLNLEDEIDFGFIVEKGK